MHYIYMSICTHTSVVLLNIYLPFKIAAKNSSNNVMHTLVKLIMQGISVNDFDETHLSQCTYTKTMSY